jgi:hypothetical protein
VFLLRIRQDCPVDSRKDDGRADPSSLVLEVLECLVAGLVGISNILEFFISNVVELLPAGLLRIAESGSWYAGMEATMDVASSPVASSLSI